ncbi:MAG: response regulator [Candidatus Margulisiibacteriota bacterium]
MDEKKILIVDDEEDFGFLVKLNLESAGGYIVEHETRGKDAVQTARLFKPDLILLDIMMPDLMGSKVAEQIEADSVLGQTPIIFLTAVVKEKDVEKAGGMIGGHPCLAKPINTDKLLESIEQNISRTVS